MTGVTAVRVITGAGKEIQWAGTGDGRRRRHQRGDRPRRRPQDQGRVRSPAALGRRRRSGQGRQPRQSRPASRSPAIPTRPSRKPTPLPKAIYGIPVITHCCLEPHGQVVEWKGDQVNYWPSTQNVSGYRRRSRPSPQGPGRQIHVKHAVHGRRLRQQVPGRPLGRGVRRALQGERRQAGEAVPGPRTRN